MGDEMILDMVITELIRFNGINRSGHTSYRNSISIKICKRWGKWIDTWRISTAIMCIPVYSLVSSKKKECLPRLRTADEQQKTVRRKHYYSSITFVDVQKRHHTRFFPVGSQNADRRGNYQVGAVVDAL
ncbi:predicted protein [Lichtheimia corymbifera JMRC:FSU:9682]|uniref:Uncharacterized protein n=1 Tax=Lichtheimia corymbifera JMRC:FSU:9682 TaxID=1263082 RepID=A0A068SGN0_9FUNG|nr:predicted protein [Lichtheimia corymbifera JMRC:FSU:9682]